MITFGQLKSNLRKVLFASGEANNLVVAHNKFFLDAVIDLQQWVACLQSDNTSQIPHCATFFNCGLTVFDAPRGIIKGVSVIDKINPTTKKEDATADDDWCSEIKYQQVDICHVHKFLARGGCSSCHIPLFFGFNCRKGSFPLPTDEGLGTLPKLPLGYHYAQPSTDDPRGRATAGVWAQERGKIYIAPWLQSTETAIVKWDGIKRTWADSDPIEDDPLYATALEEYVRWQHAAKFDKDDIEAARAATAYQEARANLIHQCREETRVRGCEPSHARSSAASASSNTPLFYNEQQQFTADCTGNTNGSSVTVTIPSGTVASNISVADANQKAMNEAQSQAQAQLDCQQNQITYQNDAQSATATCSSDENSPAPDGSPVTVTVQAGEVTSAVSKADANATALALAESRAQSQLACTFWNSEQAYTASCPQGTTGSDVTKTVAAHTFSSTISQSDADSKALNDAKNQAQQALVCDSIPPTIYGNTIQQVRVTRTCSGNLGSPGVPQQCILTVIVNVAPNAFQSLSSVADANLTAINYATALANQRADTYCQLGQCGVKTFFIP